MDVTPAQLKGQIRYYLADLRAQNGQHGFEQLSRNLARLRFVPNLLPATGPVGAGGDQGRDFESYWTAIDHSVTASGNFWKNSSGATKVVGTCTLQVDVDRKIRSDIAKLVDNGDVERVLYFCEANVPVGKRHGHQAWAKDRGIELEIVDGDGIAELLCDRDTFWIAQTYLQIPADLMPQEEPSDDWYSELRAKYRARAPVAVSVSDFLEVKRGLRRATFQEVNRADLTMWLGRMAMFLSSETPRQLLRSATYEIVVASYRGKGDMAEELERLRDFFSDVDEFIGLADLQNAVSLTVYAFGAFAFGRLAIDPAEMVEWRDRVQNLLDAHIEIASGPNRRTGLLHARAQLGVLSVSGPTSAIGEEAFVIWDRMLDEARNARLFPIEQFADFLANVIKRGGDSVRYLALSARADELVMERSGKGVLGDKAMARASALLERGDVLQSLAQLHIVLHAWYTGDRLPGAVVCLTMIAETYRKLGLVYAAKNYALAAAFIAQHADPPEIKKLLPDALFEVVEGEFMAGNFFGMAQLLLMALAAHVTLDEDPMNFEIHPHVEAAISRLSAMMGFALRHGPTVEAAMVQAAAAWPENLREVVWNAAVDATSFWNEEHEADAFDIIGSNLIDRPFADLGKERRIVWRCLGIRWEVSFLNTYLLTQKAEEFAAQLQIALCALAQDDLALLPLDVAIAVELDHEIDAPALVEVDIPGEILTSQLTLPTRPTTDEADPANLTAIGMVIRLCSALSQEMFEAVFRAKARSLLEQIHVARPYPELFQEFVLADLFQAEIRAAIPNFGGTFSFRHREAVELGWRDGPGPTYSGAEAQKSLEMKYNSAKCVRFTIGRLITDPVTRSLLVEMHEKGLRDWQILGVLANFALNQRIGVASWTGSDEALIESMRAAFNGDETPDMAIEPSLLTPEVFRAFERIYIRAHADSWGLAPMDRAANTLAFERFMAARYRMHLDDFPHDDIFRWASTMPLHSAEPL